MIKKYKKRIYTLVLALLLTLVPIARSNADAPFQKKPKSGPNYSYTDSSPMNEARLYFGYDDGKKQRSFVPPEYEEISYCKTHSDERDCSSDSDRCRIGYERGPEILEWYQAYPPKATGPSVLNFIGGPPSPPHGFFVAATNNVGHGFQGLSYLGASPAEMYNPGMIPANQAAPHGTEVSGFCGATFRWGAAGAMSNAPVPKPGLTVNPSTSWTYEFIKYNIYV